MDNESVNSSFFKSVSRIDRSLRSVKLDMPEHSRRLDELSAEVDNALATLAEVLLDVPGPATGDITAD